MRSEKPETTNDSRKETHERGESARVRRLAFYDPLHRLAFLVDDCIAGHHGLRPADSNRTESPVFYGFCVVRGGLSWAIIAHRYFPYQGLSPRRFFPAPAGDECPGSRLWSDGLGGSQSSLSLLYIIVIIFSSAYFELLETMLIAAVTCAIISLRWPMRTSTSMR